MWARSWACLSFPTYTRSAPPTAQHPPGSRVEGPHPGVLPLSQLSPQDWEVQYQQDTPVAPRFDINAPDLYIPGFTSHRCWGVSRPDVWVPGAQAGFPSSDKCLCVCLLQPWLSSPTSWWLALPWGPRTGKDPGAGDCGRDVRPHLAVTSQ